MKKPEVLEQLEKDIKKGVGKRCKDFQYGCFTCEVYFALQIMEAFYESGED